MYKHDNVKNLTNFNIINKENPSDEFKIVRLAKFHLLHKSRDFGRIERRDTIDIRLKLKSIKIELGRFKSQIVDCKTNYFYIKQKLGKYNPKILL